MLPLILIITFIVGDYSSAAPTAAPPQEYVQAASKVKHGQLLLAMAYVESRYNMAAVGSLGELGPLQLRPEFHPAVKTAKTVLDHFRIADRYLTKLERQCSYMGDAWFICYNLGVRKAKTMYANLIVDNARQNSYALKVTEANRALRKWSPIQGQSKTRLASDATKIRGLSKDRGYTGSFQERPKRHICKEGLTTRGTLACFSSRDSTRYGTSD
jgi:hypothetical protein